MARRKPKHRLDVEELGKQMAASLAKRHFDEEAGERQMNRAMGTMNNGAAWRVEESDDLDTFFTDGLVDTDTWLSNCVMGAMKAGASDMLLQTNKETDYLTCDIRIDNKMRSFSEVSGKDTGVIMGRFKSASNLASSGSFAPEETIYEVEVGAELRKARVALFRKADGGEAVVFRLPPTGPVRRLHELSFSDLNLQLTKDMLLSSNRMVMIAGPMGSGKTTTAHGALLEVADSTRTVWTIEDPVERIIPGLVQLEVDEKNDASFSALLPYLVRSDYNTLFLGEIRDNATADAAVRQSKAGRQVITTIHANDNVTALLRLIDLAKDTELSVLDSVRGVISQRLVACLNPSWDRRDPLTKYAGRVPIHEVLDISEELIEAVMAKRPLGQIRAIAAKTSESTFARDADRLIREGITDEEEIARTLGV